MKCTATIRKQLRALRKMIELPGFSEKERDEAYAMETALLWVLYDRCDWTPESAVKENRKPGRKEKK